MALIDTDQTLQKWVQRRSSLISEYEELLEKGYTETRSTLSWSGGAYAVTGVDFGAERLRDLKEQIEEITQFIELMEAPIKTQSVVADSGQSEKVITGWQAIAQLLGVSERTARKYKDELWEREIIWYGLKGTPPRKVVKAWPSDVNKWWEQKRREIKKE